MKKVYIEPVVKNVALPEPMMQETPYSAWDPMGKEKNDVVEEEEDDERKNKFDIKDYNPEIVEKTPNTDPKGFSRSKCAIF